jgi:acetyl-CoA C-acetyltransferase
MAIFILGGTQSDFARNLSREGREVSDLIGDLVDGALADAAIEPADVGAIHVGNAFGELFNGQGQLGALPATVRPALWGVPAARHEAACASGSIAVLAAMAELEAGRCDVALVIGVEQERNVPGAEAARFLGAAAWVGHEGEGARYLWPHMFSRIGDAYAERWGLDRRHLAAISRKNLGNARKNPRAQTRGWTIGDATFAEDDATNPVIEGRLRRADCAQVTDGGAAIVLASERYAAGWARARDRALPQTARLLGWGHRTAGLPLDAKLARAEPGGLLFPHVAAAFADACRRARAAAGSAAAGREGVRDGVPGGVPDGINGLDGVEVHDCFTTTEYMAIDHLGLTPPGQSWRAIEDGRTELGGALPVNPSGGLIGGGHPVGATGVRMVLDAARQVTDRAGDYQVAGARTFGTLNLGGSATTVVSFIVGAR